MVGVYTTTSIVANFLGISETELTNKVPDIESRISRVEDYIDRRLQTTFKSKQVSNEYHTPTRTYGIDGWVIFTKHRPIISVDKLEIWNGCLPEDTIIYTDKGAKRMSSIREGDFVAVFDRGKIEYAKVTKKKYTGYRDVYRIVAKDYEIEATDNHPFLVVVKKASKPERDSKGKFRKWNFYGLEWKQLKDLRPGDIIVVSLENRKYEITEIDSVKLSKPLMRLLGFWIGDGCYSSKDHSIEFFLFDTVDLDEYYRFVQEAFGVKPKLYSSKEKENALMKVHSKKWVKWMKKNGFIGHANTKRIPEWIFKIPNELKIEFIRGYIEADGWIRKDFNSANVTSINRKLLEDFKTLCNQVGLGTGRIIECRNRKGAFGKKPVYYMDIYFAKKNSVRGLTKGMKIDGILLETLCKNGFGFRKIQKIEYVGKKNVYDIEVENYHNFIANGIVVHNSEWEDWVQTRTEGRNKDYWVNYERGEIFLMMPLFPMIFIPDRSQIRVTYTYGRGATETDRSAIPKDLEDVATKLVAIDILTSESYKAILPSGDNILSNREKIEEWKQYCENWLRMNMEFVPIDNWR